MNNFAYVHIAERLFGRAHAIEPGALRAIIGSPVGQRILSGGDADEEHVEISEVRRQRMSMLTAGTAVTVAGGAGQYWMTESGVAVIPVTGVLSQRFSWLATLCGWTTYQGLAASLEGALSDDRVQAILMDVDSPGGETAGLLDVADQIIAARSQKKIWAVANPLAASAGYVIAGSAQRLLVPRLASVGCIGVVAVHADQSAYDKAAGVNFTAVYSGARKIDGWEHAPLSTEAQSSWQADVDHARDRIAELVGRQGRISASRAVGTEAALYHDSEAVKAGLADAVGTFDEALDELSGVAGGQPSGAPKAENEDRVEVDPIKATGWDLAIESVNRQFGVSQPKKPAVGHS